MIVKMLRPYMPYILILTIVSFFFKDFILEGLIPIPADTIVGMYHPWRDYYSKEYPNGIPFKNFLITDPVRQQYPWKLLTIEYLKNGQLPLWNPYTFSGTPLLANFQSGTFYPLNIIFFIFPFDYGWSIYIFLQFLLGGIFMYLYLNNLNLKKEAPLLGSIVFIFSGVFIAWGWWGNIIHTLIWLPLILLCADKIVFSFNEAYNSKIKNQKSKIQIKNKIILWSLLFIFSFSSSFFAGHLQVFFYMFLTVVFYLIARCYQYKVNKKVILLVTCYLLLVTFITSVQWIPTLKFILQSARSIDQINWNQPGWFIPWQHLIQFLAPDFFGNPTTLNYWGVWNYGEFIGYIGILPLILVIYALIFRKDKKVLFFGSLFFLSLIFSLPTFIAKIPYHLKIPPLSTSQPTRLLVITDFSLAILAALGIDYFLKNKDIKSLSKIFLVFFLIYSAAWLFVSIGLKWLTGSEWLNNLSIAKRNLIFPSFIFLTSATIPFILSKLKFKKVTFFILHCSLLIVVIDLFRFGWKFLPFTKEEWIFPKTKTIEFLQSKQKEGPFRIMSTDERIFPPNFSIVFKIETIDGYDPLYLKNYALLINKMEKRDLNTSFNRIITPKNYESPIADLLNVKYVLSLTDLTSPKLKKVFQEGETRVYENLNFIKKPYFRNYYER